MYPFVLTQNQRLHVYKISKIPWIYRIKNDIPILMNDEKMKIKINWIQ